jgi:hypothetical protein
MINVTKTFAPIEEYNKQVQRAWDNQWLTNRWWFWNLNINKYLTVSILLLLIMEPFLCKSLKLLGKEVKLLLRLSCVATTAAIVCCTCFVDIHPDYLTIDETKIEAAITNKTTTILATHVLEIRVMLRLLKQLQNTTKSDLCAAHSFGVTYRNKCI